MPIEQTQLFNVGLDKNYVANEILKDLNNLNTIWKGSFEIDDISLEKWEHTSDPDKVLSIIYVSNVIKDFGDDNNFTYFCLYPESEKELQEIQKHSDLLKRYENDRDLAVYITPTMIIVYWHKFERKY